MRAAHKYLNLAWVDVETTGLVPSKDFLLEVAVIITTPDLEESASLSSVIRHPEMEERDWDRVLSKLDRVVLDMHTHNGLFADVFSDPPMGCTLTEFEELACRLLQDHAAVGSPMCGSTPAFDRRFLRFALPNFERLFSYRHFDMTTLKYQQELWGGPEYPAEETVAHRACADIRHSLEVAKWARKHWLR